MPARRLRRAASQARSARRTSWSRRRRRRPCRPASEKGWWSLFHTHTHRTRKETQEAKIKRHGEASPCRETHAQFFEYILLSRSF